LGDLATSFAENQHYPRGRRLVLYDAEGGFDRNFDWWKESGKHRLVEPQLPFENGRSDLLTGSGSRLDIQNINLLAVCRQSISESWVCNLRDCLAHLV